MKKAFKELSKKYYVDGDADSNYDKYATLYKNYESFKDELDEGEVIIEKIENSLFTYQGGAESLNYPIVFFDYAGSDSGEVFEADEIEKMFEKAKDYFKQK